MTNLNTQVSLSSVLKRAGKSIETALSVVDIADDAIAVATNYMARIKEEQLKEGELKSLEFANQLKIRKANAANDMKAIGYQIGAKARQIQSLPEFEENIEAFENLLK